MSNSPINYTDPSGHINCTTGYDPDCYNGGNDALPTGTTPTPVPSDTQQEILVCGIGAGATCENTAQYDGQPLGPYDNILPNQNALWIGVDKCNNGDPKYCAAMRIYNQVANNPGSYHLVGHSAGGSSVIWAVRMLQDAGLGNRIASITLLDPARDGQWDFNTGNGSVSVNIKEMANEIVANGNNVFVGDFTGDPDGSDKDITGLNDSNYAQFIPPDGATINGHFLLATSNKIFDAAAGYWEWQK